jgi:hypothetical protein
MEGRVPVRKADRERERDYPSYVVEAVVFPSPNQVKIGNVNLAWECVPISSGGLERTKWIAAGRCP